MRPHEHNPSQPRRRTHDVRDDDLALSIAAFASDHLVFDAGDDRRGRETLPDISAAFAHWHHATGRGHVTRKAALQAGHRGHLRREQRVEAVGFNGARQPHQGRAVL